MGPVSLNPGSMVDELGLCCSVAPDPFSIGFLGCKFISASFRPRLMCHEPPSYLLWPDTILLFQPFPEPEPDIAIELVEGFCRVDCPVVGSPSSYHRVDGLYLVDVIVVRRATCGHRLDFRLYPLQPFLATWPKVAPLTTICSAAPPKKAQP